MAIKKNNNLVENINVPSQLDMGGIFKDVHDFPGHSLRVRNAGSVVPVHYTHFNVVYDIDDNPTQATYFAGTSSEITDVAAVADVAGSLNNKYFFLFEGRTNKKFHIWFNVGGAGIDPAPANSNGIEILIGVNDPAIIVSMAIELTLKASFSTHWNVVRRNASLNIKTIKFGETNNTVDFNSGFTILKSQDGEQSQVSSISIDYEDGSPVYEGQVLKGLKFNTFSGTFEPSVDFSDADLNMDIRDLNHVTDSVQVGDGVTTAKVDVQNKSLSVNRYEKLLPLLANANWLKLVDFEEVVPSFSGDVATISYLKNGDTIAKAIFTFVTDLDWSFKLESYINDDGGNTLLDDDSTPLFLD